MTLSYMILYMLNGDGLCFFKNTQNHNREEEKGQSGCVILTIFLTSYVSEKCCACLRIPRK